MMFRCSFCAYLILLNTTVQTKFHTISYLPGKQSMNPEYDARGAIQASCNYNNLPKLKVTGKNKLVVGLVHAD